LFLIKGRDAHTVCKLAAEISPNQWHRVDAHLRPAEAHTARVHRCPFDIRVVVCERTNGRGQVYYYALMTNLPFDTFGIVALVLHARRTIEAFNKVVDNVLYLTHLRTGSSHHWFVASISDAFKELHACSILGSTLALPAYANPFRCQHDTAAPPRSIMMAITTFEWLMTCSIQLASIICEKGTPIGSAFIQGKPHFATLESGRKYAEGKFERHL
jgi:hypothetical protein